MALLNFDSSQVAPDTGVGDPVPAGWYNVMIDESDVKPTKTGGGLYLECRFSVIDGQYAGRKLFSRFNIKNDSPVAQEIGYKQLSAVCHAVGLIGMVQDSQMLHGKPMKVKVKVRPAKDDYEASNDITAYKNINEKVDTGTVGGAPGVHNAAAAATAGPAGFPTQPWANPGAAAQPQPAAPMGAPAGFPGGLPAGFPGAAAPAQPPVAQAVAAQSAPAQPAPVVAPPVPAPAPAMPPVKRMTAKANGQPYEAFVTAGWKDEQLVEHGYMEIVQPTPPATPAAPVVPTAAAPATPAAPTQPAVGPVAGAATLTPPWMQKPAG